MAQKVLHQYKDEIKSWDINERSLGATSPGRIRGFDVVADSGSTGSTLTFTLGHQNNLAWALPGITTYSGLEKADTSNVLESNLGVLILNDGTMVLEDGTVGTFDIDISQAAGERQRFWIVAEHTWTLISGGSAVTYSVIAGAVTTGATYSDPVLTSPGKQIVIAEYDVPKTSEYSRTLISITTPDPTMAGTNLASRGPIQSFSNGRNALQLIEDAGLISRIEIEADYLDTTEVAAQLYTQAQVDALIAAAKPYTTYVANLSQSGTAAPAAEILENSMGTITWARTGVGIYEGTLGTPASDVVYAWCNIQSGDAESVFYDCKFTADDTIRVRSAFNGALTDASLDLTSIELRLYEP